MKKIIIFTLFTALLSPLSFIKAEEQNETVQSVPTRQNILRERIEKQRASYIQNLQEAREIAQQYRQAENDEERNSLRQKTRNGFLVRLTNAVERLVAMQDRIEKRIELMDADGVDVVKAKELLSESRTATQNILDSQDELKTLLENNPNPKDEETRKEAQAIFDTIKENFKEARMSLVDSVKALKDSVHSELEDEINDDSNTESENDSNNDNSDDDGSEENNTEDTN